VDSDLDGSRNAGVAQYGPGATSGSGLNTSSSTQAGQGSSNAGPHSSSLANKIDPRVDSDLDGSRNAGAAKYGPGATNTSSGPGYNTAGSNFNDSTGAGYGNNDFASQQRGGLGQQHGGLDNSSTGAGYGNNGLTNQQHGGLGQHNSGFDNSSTGAGYGNDGLTGNSHTSTHTGGGLAGQQHGGLVGQQHGDHATHHLDGPAPNTAGPHSKNVLNKLDPRIDSDRDGSKTVGGNPQY
jgi:hypothetical protein